MIRDALLGLLAVIVVLLAILTCIGFRPHDIIRMVSHPVMGGPAAPAGEKTKAALPKPPSDVTPGAIRTADYVVLGIYFALMLGIGAMAGRNVKTTRRFFLADGNVNFLIVGISILATYLSALTMMALPGMSFGPHDLTYVVQLPCLLITAVVITGIVLPRYRAAGVVSVYQFLEQRIHVSVRLIASLSFMIFAVGRMGLVLYLPALAFSTVSGMPLAPCIVVMGVVITLYTVFGGIEAVIWTDVIQAAVFILGAALTLGYIFSDLDVRRFLEIGEANHKFRWFIPSLSFTKITTVWLILETLFQTIRIYGTEQDMAQRYMTTGSTAKARRSVWIAILLYIPLGFIFYFLGVAFFVFYQAHPDPGLPAKADTVYPYFIMHQLPAGVAGFVIAAIFAAGMSTISSLMNSASTVCVEDFLKRFGPVRLTDRDHLRWAKILTLVWGALHIGMGLLFMEIQQAQIVWQKLMGICTNGILGLMILAFLPIRIRCGAAIAGFVVSYACLVAVMYSPVNFLLWPVIGNTACVLVALAVNPLFDRRETMKAKIDGPGPR